MFSNKEGLRPHELGSFQQMNLSPGFWVPVFGYQIMSWIPVFVWFCVGEDARTCPCQRLFWHLCRWNYQISNKNDQTTIKGMFWTVVCFFQFGWCCFWFCIDTGDGLYGFGKAAADGLLGSEGAEYRPLAIEALLRVRRPFGWVPNDEMSLGIVVWHDGIYLSIYIDDSGFTLFCTITPWES